MEKGNAYTKFIVAGKFHVLAGKETVVGNVIVGMQYGSLRSFYSRHKWYKDMITTLDSSKTFLHTNTLLQHKKTKFSDFGKG